MLVLSTNEILSLLPMKDAIDVMERTFMEFGRGNVNMPTRTNIGLKEYGGTLLSMAAFVGGSFSALGQKGATIYPENPAKHGLPTLQATVQLFDAETGRCIALLNGTALTALRTGAVSGVATRHLAITNAKRVGIFGAGVQAESQLRAVAAVRRIESAKVYDPIRQRQIQYCEKMTKELDINVVPGETARDTVRDKEIIVCASTSRTPVFNGGWLEPGVHINAIGAFTPDTREMDTETISRSKVVVDSREATLKEAGDLLIPITEKAFTAQHIWAELGEVVLGQKTGRESDDEITVFKSVGLAIEDVSIAKSAYENAIKRQIGIRVEI